MSSSREPSEGSHSYRALRQQVLEPVASATSCAERERTEISAELEALESFETAVSDLSLQGEEVRPLGDRTADRAAAVRDAYRETVMDLDHYDREYGEPLLQSLASELSPDIAAFLGPDTQQPMTEFHRSVISNAVAESVRTRRQVIERIEAEISSLTDSRNDLAGLLNRLDSACDPDAERALDELDAISHRRQQLLHRNLPFTDDEHSFRAYLYEDEPWTYPVLTSITHLKNAVVDEDAAIDSRQ